MPKYSIPIVTHLCIGLIRYPQKSTAKNQGKYSIPYILAKITVIAPNLELDPSAKAPAKLNKLNSVTVSYTHLTLPTKRIV